MSILRFWKGKLSIKNYHNIGNINIHNFPVVEVTFHSQFLRWVKEQVEGVLSFWQPNNAIFTTSQNPIKIQINLQFV